MPRVSSKKDKALLARVSEVRCRTFGSRGRARFARTLGLPLSTYRAYESTRPPPVSVLVRMHRIAGVDLRWLLTGQFPIDTLANGPILPAPQHEPIADRFARGLGGGSKSVAAMTALLDLLADVAELQEEAAPPAERDRTKQTPLSRLPVMGRTAAGLTHFWSDGASGRGFPDVLASASDVLGVASGRLTRDEEIDSESPSHSVRLERYAQPRQLGGVSVCEFLSAPGVIREYPDAFALRVDGDSMSPAIQHGDLVIVSPSHAARAGRPAVVQLRRQIGMTCKLFRPAGSRIRLIPINEHFPTTTHGVDQLVWALAVLYRVRLSPPAH